MQSIFQINKKITQIILFINLFIDFTKKIEIIREDFFLILSFIQGQYSARIYLFINC